MFKTFPTVFNHLPLVRKFVSVSATALITFAVYADDTEIYTDQIQSGGAPNVLFIMDTSGSMDSGVTITEKYDPEHNYADDVESGPVCANDRLYWRQTNDSIPTCDSSRWILKSTNRCDTSWKALDMDSALPSAASEGSIGFYTDRFTRYDDTYDYWWRLSSSHHSAPRHTHAECRSDQQSNTASENHGELTGDGKEFVYRYSPAYKSTKDNDFKWTGRNSRSRSYVVYTANYLNYYHHTTSTYLGTRMQVVQDALVDLIKNAPTINAGLMEFNSNTDESSSGASVTSAMVSLGSPDSTERDDMIDIVEDMSASGYTPLAESLHEAKLYWTGGAIKYGTLANESVAESRNPPIISSTDYKSSFQTDCSENYQVLLTDGQPTLDDSSDSTIRSYLNNATWLSTAVIATDSCDYDWDDPSTSCLDDLAEYMNKVDLSTTDSPNINHTVTTYTIGFDIASVPAAQALLESTADHGGGQFFEAHDSLDLANAFNETIAQILETTGSFSSPAISVNALNRLVHNDELYFALFEPGDSEHWPGNIKRYRLEYQDATLIEPAGYVIVDENGVRAVDKDTAQIVTSAKSWWRIGSDPDGNEVARGGLAHRLYDYNPGTEQFEPGTRENKVFTYVEDYDFDDFDGTGISLISLHEDNGIFVPADIGIKPIAREDLGLLASDADADFTKLLQWGRGVNTYNTNSDASSTAGRPEMGAPLHAKPVVVTYAVDPDNVDPDLQQTNVVFAITNDGYFHASRTLEPSDNGRMEHFAFVPAPTLVNFKDLAEDDGTLPLYGLDGGLTIWRNDVDNDGNIEPADGDHVIAYFGQRRGGRAIFALDVTDLTTPKLLWVINPDNTEQADDDRFANLGQSWATPQRAKMLVGISQHPLL